MKESRAAASQLKTYLLKFDWSAQNPRDRPLSRTSQTFWGEYPWAARLVFYLVKMVIYLNLKTMTSTDKVKYVSVTLNVTDDS